MVTTAPSKAASGSMLTGITPPTGATLSVTGFRLPGSTKPIVPGSGPVQVADPITGKVTGTLAVRMDGTFTFTPAAGFTGTVPTVYVTVKSSDGQSKEAPLTVIVQPAAGGCALLWRGSGRVQAMPGAEGVHQELPAVWMDALV
jgi:hypothetical protein